MLVFLNYYAAPLTNSSIMISEFEKVWLPWCRLESLPGDCFDGDIISLVVYFWVSKGITDVSLTICIPGSLEGFTEPQMRSIWYEPSCIAKISDEQSGAAADDELADGDDDVNQ